MPTEPRVSLAHLDRMCDSTGMIQHAIYSVPRRESGYTVDDNARALSLCVRLWSLHPDERMLSRITQFMSLIEDARRPGGGFRNLMSYQRQWIDTDATGDCQGQAIRALSEVLSSRLPQDLRTLAHELIDATLPKFAEIRSLRAEAYLVIAYGRLWDEGNCCWQQFEDAALLAAQHIADCFRRSRRPDWHWFESRMTYVNAVLPHALFVAASRWPANGFLEVAQESFAFLDLHTSQDGMFWPVGNDGWYPHGEGKARYDQQPIEAATMADAALAGMRVGRNEGYRASLERACRWFHGENSLGLAVADPSYGACCDGAHPSGLNRNQGAESTLAYLWSELCLSASRHLKVTERTVPATASPARPSLQPPPLHTSTGNDHR